MVSVGYTTTIESVSTEMHPFPYRAEITHRSSFVFEDELMLRSKAFIVATQMRSLVILLLKNPQRDRPLRKRGVGHRPVDQGR